MAADTGFQSRSAWQSHSLVACRVVLGTFLFVFPLAAVEPSSSESQPPVLSAALTTSTANGPSADRAAPDHTGVLTEEALVAEVLARNPSIEQMVAAWSAAQSRIVQERALDDPMVAGMIAPDSFDSADDAGYRIEVSQQFYFPGKRRLRGRAAAFEAAAAQRDIERVRQELALEARLAYYDYFLIRRSQEINADAIEIIKQSRANAQARFETGQSLEQDVLQADVELGRQEERRLELDRLEAVVRARINILLDQASDTPLPAVPMDLSSPTPPDAEQVLVDQALAQRAELQRLLREIEAERARWSLASKEFYPDYEVFGAYDSFWRVPDTDLRAMVGVRVNAPLRIGKRRGAVSEAQSRLAEKAAAYRKLSNDVRLEVTRAHRGVVESDNVVQLYSQQLLQTAERSVSQAQAAYATGRSDFLTLLTAQRNLIELRERYYSAVAESYRRRAELRRAVGEPIE